MHCLIAWFSGSVIDWIEIQIVDVYCDRILSISLLRRFSTDQVILIIGCINQNPMIPLHSCCIKFFIVFFQSMRRRIICIHRNRYIPCYFIRKILRCLNRIVSRKSISHCDRQKENDKNNKDTFGKYGRYINSPSGYSAFYVLRAFLKQNEKSRNKYSAQ